MLPIITKLLSTTMLKTNLSIQPNVNKTTPLLSYFEFTDIRPSSSGIQFKPKNNCTSTPTERIPTAGYRPPTVSDTDVVPKKVKVK